MRIISLLPSATEILCHLISQDEMVGAGGVGGFLVGRSHECDYPSFVSHLPVLTAAKTTGDDPGAIDKQVKEHVASGRSLYMLDSDLFAQLRPDLILTQDLCDVCSIDLNTVRAIAARLNPPPKVITLNSTTVEGVLDDFLTIGSAIGRERSAAAAIATWQDQFNQAAHYVNAYIDGPNVAFLDWTDPLFIAGHWTPQLIERAGAKHPLNPTVADDAAGAAAGLGASQRRAPASRQITADELIASNPEAIVICPCGLNLSAARSAAQALAQEAWWPDLAAVRNNRVAIVDGNQMFNRSGPRLLDAYRWLVGWVNDVPELIPPEFPWE